jgi:hypothetical protein
MSDPIDVRLVGRDAIWLVENALDAPPMGSLRVGALVNDLLLRVANGGEVAPLSDTLRLARALLHTTAAGSGESAPDLSGRILVTLVDDSPRIADLVLPVVEALHDRAVVLPARDDVREVVPEHTRVISDRQLGTDARSRWYPRFRRAAPSWGRSLRALVRQGHLDRAALPALVHLLVVQTRRAVRYEEAFSRNRPDAVLVEYDRGTFAAPIVAAARSLGIPTATMVHGSVHPRGYTPLLADLAFCWGEAQANQLEQAGAPTERLVVTGCPRVGLHPWDREGARADLGLDDRPLILLATNNLMAPRDRLELARAAVDAVATLGDTVQFGLRLHPRESVDDYRTILEQRADLHLLGGDRAAGDQVLAASDLVLCGITAFADEAAIAGVPAMIIDLSGRADVTVGLGATGPVATSRAELTGLLDDWSRGGRARTSLEQRTAARGRALCAASGHDAARRVADQVRLLADGDRAATPPAVVSPGS